MDDRQTSRDPASLERLFEAARSPRIRELHASGQSPAWVPAGQQVLHAAARARRHAEAVEWLIRALEDDQRKWFAADVIAALGTPEELLDHMITAAIAEPDPSFNRRFVDPCVAVYGPQFVAQLLFEVIEAGSARQIAGAARAHYWARATKRQPLMTHQEWLYFQEVFLRAFARTRSLDARRSLLPQIELGRLENEPHLAALAHEVLVLARASGDDYLIRRSDIQLGNAALFPVLPPLADE